MAIRTAGDIADAFAAGRWHSQRFFKNTQATAGDGSWYDWAFSGGQPAYDARVGATLTRTTFAATGNDAIWFPAISAGQERRLAGLTFWSNCQSVGAQVNLEAMLYDLVAVYPLIDGDSTDPQVMDNTTPLPRYTDGVGLRAVLVNHVAPMLTGVSSGCSLTYTDADGVQRTTGFGIQNIGQNRSAARIPGASGGASADLFMNLNAPKGVRSIDSLTFGTAPGGLWAIYLVKPVASVSHRSGDINLTPVMTESCFCTDRSFDIPLIPDGATLGFFTLVNGSSRIVTTIYGSARFIWG
jgi:hypothetical protein